ncbi:MAG: VanZ family protein [Pseudomonadota bacterium]
MTMDTRIHRIPAAWGPVIIYCAAIFAQSSFPTPDAVPSFYMSDKLLHACAYALMALLFYRALGQHRVGASPVKRSILTIVFTVIYGISDEFHQSFVPGRSPEVLDVAADGVGALIGVIAAQRFRHSGTRRRAAPTD